MKRFSEPSASESPPHRLRVWSCLWGGGLAWALHLAAVWAIAEFGCMTAMARPGPLEVSWVAWGILGVSVLCLALAGIATLESWRQAHSGAGSGGERPARFAAGSGVVVNSLFMFIIIAQTLPVFFYLRDCGTYLL